MNACLVALMLVALNSPASADERKLTDPTTSEKQNIERVCAITHRPGAAMRDCIKEQTDKVVQGKQTQSNNRNMEALTDRQIGNTK